MVRAATEERRPHLAGTIGQAHLHLNAWVARVAEGYALGLIHAVDKDDAVGGLACRYELAFLILRLLLEEILLPPCALGVEVPANHADPEGPLRLHLK